MQEIRFKFIRITVLEIYIGQKMFVKIFNCYHDLTERNYLDLDQSCIRKCLRKFGYVFMTIFIVSTDNPTYSYTSKYINKRTSYK